MSEAIIIRVPAVPVAQPRPRATVAHGGKRARMHEVTQIKNADGSRKPHPIVAFKATVAHAASAAYSGAPLDGPLVVSIACVLPRPNKLRWATKPMPRAPHVGKPDCDNLAKSVCDALSKITWNDDAQINELTVKKWIASGDEQPHVEIRIERLAV
jgi:Holliday junction resolvase RusA-like endonuclease